MIRFAVLLVVATVSAIPNEQTPEVAEARAAHLALVEEAKAGLHAAYAPVNNDIQAAQIASTYLADLEDVAAAKAEFLAAFADAEAGGLAAKQAPAPVHEIVAPTPLVATALATPVVHHAATFGYAGYPYAHAAYPYAHAAYPTYAHAAYPYAAQYAAYPYAAAGHLPYYGYGVGLGYAGLPVVTVEAAEPAAEAADVMEA